MITNPGIDFTWQWLANSQGRALTWENDVAHNKLCLIAKTCALGKKKKKKNQDSGCHSNLARFNHVDGRQ